ncbi:MAG: hypothetical protein JNK64_27205 [Myxococcales bacterium]|nr:hypothetical protein [Myxococcales bacterium]
MWGRPPFDEEATRARLAAGGWSLERVIAGAVIIEGADPGVTRLHLRRGDDQATVALAPLGEPADPLDRVMAMTAPAHQVARRTAAGRLWASALAGGRARAELDALVANPCADLPALVAHLRARGWEIADADAREDAWDGVWTVGGRTATATLTVDVQWASYRFADAGVVAVVGGWAHRGAVTIGIRDGALAAQVAALVLAA